MEANQWHVTYGTSRMKLAATHDRMLAIRTARDLVLGGTINVRLEGRTITPWHEESFTMGELQ